MPVVVMRTFAVDCWNAPCPAVVRSAFHWLMPTVVVPAVSVALASEKRSATVASPSFQSVAVVIVVVMRPVTDKMIELAGKSMVLSVVVPPVERVTSSVICPVTVVEPFTLVWVAVVAVVVPLNAIIVLREFRDEPVVPARANWIFTSPPVPVPVPLPPAKFRAAPAMFVPLPPVPLMV